MSIEREEEEASIDEAMTAEMHHERTREAKDKQDRIEKITRDDHLDAG